MLQLRVLRARFTNTANFPPEEPRIKPSMVGIPDLDGADIRRQRHRI